MKKEYSQVNSCAIPAFVRRARARTELAVLLAADKRARQTKRLYWLSLASACVLRAAEWKGAA